MTATSPSQDARADPRRSAWRALPFQVGFMVVVIVMSLAGVPVQPWLALLLVPALWAAALAEIVFRSALPAALQYHYLIFITAGPFAGSALNVYGALPDWDTLVHFDSGVLVAWIGMLFVRRAEEHTGMPSPRWFALTVMVLTPMAFACAWEICEFASDAFIGTTSQGSLADTMTDLLAGTLGGMLTVVLVLLFPWPKTLVPPSLARPAAG